mmetsp:Transcript_12933/g.30675  ORF Transcript_12933/g.30675 Transcript_12933/m.30675 type:complete len:145 (+) Transcript_12933:911-1345(+)
MPGGSEPPSGVDAVDAFNARVAEDLCAFAPVVLSEAAGCLEAVAAIEAQNSGASYSEAASAISSCASAVRKLRQGGCPAAVRGLLLRSPPLSAPDWGWPPSRAAEGLPLLTDTRRYAVGLEHALSAVRLIVGSRLTVTNDAADL